MRFGVVGTNFISKEFVSALRETQGGTVLAVCSRKQETADAFADTHGIPLRFTDYGKLLSCPDIDAVYIASPNRFHGEQAKRALLNRKHVLLEKPACPTAAEFSALLALSREQGVILLEAMRPVYTEGVAAIRDSLFKLGAVRHASLRYCQYSSRYDKFRNGIVENAFDPTLCNGALMDLGCYLAHMAVYLFGQPQSVQAVARKLSNGLDAQGVATLVYPDMLAELVYSKIADGRLPSEILGEQGSLLIHGITNPKRVQFIGRDGTEELVYQAADDEFFGMRHELAAFMEMAEGRRDAEGYQRITEQTLRVMDVIRARAGIDFQRTEG